MKIMKEMLYLLIQTMQLMQKLNPTKDAIAIEGSDSPYANIIAVRKGDEKKKKLRS